MDVHRIYANTTQFYIKDWTVYLELHNKFKRILRADCAVTRNTVIPILMPNRLKENKLTNVLNSKRMNTHIAQG